MSYQVAYLYLFNQITDKIELLKKIQAIAEEKCIAIEENTCENNE